ncbi:MAG: protein-L-isoaspartate(D-aspartate) O-methyltransferase [Anaerolineales bacterium]|nr:protein-L-isoaspartate(D-aspartate) O-methyltransferase [Anaerolineales bacterium]
MNEETNYTHECERMVREQLLGRDIRDERVLQAMKHVPRHYFVLPEHRYLAYSDGPLPIGHGQTISQPYIVALMTELLELKEKAIVLEIGTGSGYQAAILAHIADEIHSIERDKDLAQRARATLKKLGVKNVSVHVSDGSKGWPENAPYDGIIVTAASPQVPQPLKEQLNNDGRLVIPVGSRGNQFLERWIRRGEKFVHEQIAPVAFVPLYGEYGWKDDQWDW